MSRWWLGLVAHPWLQPRGGEFSGELVAFLRLRLLLVRVHGAFAHDAMGRRGYTSSHAGVNRSCRRSAAGRSQMKTPASAVAGRARGKWGRCYFTRL